MRCHRGLPARFAVAHAPAADGRCLACHDPHAADRPRLVRDEPRALCLSCHGSPPRGGARGIVDRGAFSHAPYDLGCAACHDGPHGGARARLLAAEPPDLCYRCHARKDAGKTVHAALAMGGCTQCHAAHRSDERRLLKEPPERLCAGCHDPDGLATRPYLHAPAVEGRCNACHDAHSTDEPKLVRTASSTLCLSCHDARAPAGRGTPGPRARIDGSRARVHGALARGCSSCHDTGHSSDRLHLLRGPVALLCYRCHVRVDGGPWVHGAVLAGECDGCHDPHASDRPALLRAERAEAICFRCHDDGMKRRGGEIHRPVQEAGCLGCHAPHSAGAPMDLVRGRGDETCLSCHPGVGEAARRHEALVRYGCTLCHDAHAGTSPALLPTGVNALCTSCHPDQADGAHATRTSALSHPVSGVADPMRAGRELSCTSCHDPHAAQGRALMRYGGAEPAGSCDVCHSAGAVGKPPARKGGRAR